MTHEESWLLKEKYGGEKSEAFFAACERLTKGEPLAYLIGYVPFLNTRMYLDTHPLIPRPETEYWVERAIADILDRVTRSKKTTINVLDLCAGSGCIGVAVLMAVREAQVDFAEIDPQHHSTIEKNIRENGIDMSRARIIGGDLFEKIDGVYDVILSNPPYIDPALSRTEQSVLDHEPHTALFGGVDGIELITHIMEEAQNHLTEQGVLYIEHEPEQSEAIRTLGTRHGLSGETYPDQYGVSRYTRLARKPQ